MGLSDLCKFNNVELLKKPQTSVLCDSGCLQYLWIMGLFFSIHKHYVTCSFLGKTHFNSFFKEFFNSCLLRHFQVSSFPSAASRHLPPLNCSFKGSDCKPAATWSGTEESSLLLFSGHKTFCIYIQTPHYSRKRLPRKQTLTASFPFPHDTYHKWHTILSHQYCLRSGLAAFFWQIFTALECLLIIIIELKGMFWEIMIS